MTVGTAKPAAKGENALLAAALAYARSGIAIFPCRPRRKEPIIEDNLNRATTNEEQINAWWKAYPSANIGMPTGVKNDRFVVDPDGPVGEQSLAELEAAHGPLPRTFEVRTGRTDGGRHLHFRVVDVLTRSGAKLLGPDLDVKGDGGYVLLPPSIHETGREYVIVQHCEPAQAPEWLLNLVRKDSAKQKPLNGKACGEKIPYGQRHVWLISRAGGYRRNGDSADLILAKLCADYENRCDHDPPIDDGQLQRIAQWATGKEAAEDHSAFKYELAIAEMFADMHAGSVIWCVDQRVWYAWDGKRFAVNYGEVMRHARETVTRLYCEAGAISDDEQSKRRFAAFKRAKRAEENIEKFVRFARWELALEVVTFQDTFDVDPCLFNCANGVLDLRTGKLMPHDPKFRLTKLSNIAYDSDAKCPRFEEWLLRTCGGNKELKDYVVRLMGYCLSGHTQEQSFWMIYGRTRSGKSTFIKILRGLLGDYATTLPEAAVVTTYHGNPEHALAQLANVRLATLVEIGIGKQYDEAKLKQITGQDWIGASKKYENYFEFRSKAKLVIAVNEKPMVRETQDAFWNRVKAIPFDNSVSAENQIKDLDVKLLEEEGPGILNLAAEGYREWTAEGMKEPTEVKNAAEDYRREQDVVLQFIEERCERGEQYRVTAAELFRAFIEWKEINGVRTQWSAARFGRELKRLRFESKKSGPHFWLGLQLTIRNGP